MKTSKNLLAAVALSVGLLSATGANAALESALGGQVVNDTDLNITWLANANVNGAMTWAAANSWIDSLNTTSYLGYNDWRLPTVTDTGTPGCDFSYGGTDCGWNVNTTTGEMAHLYFDELGNKSYYDTAGNPQAGWGLLNTGPFTNFQSGYYWSGTEYAPNTGYAWYFIAGYGFQSAASKNASLFALAVRPGQVVSAVPEPETYAMLLAGLGLLGFAARCRKDFTV